MTKRKVKLNIAAVLSFVLAAVAVFMPLRQSFETAAVTQAAVEREIVKNVEISAALPDNEPKTELPDKMRSVEVEVGYTEEQLKQSFLTMLNLNRCYGEALLDTELLAQAASLSLLDFAADLPGYGLAVNSCLVEGFVKSFYGVTVDLSSTRYVAVPVGDMATVFHELISVTETDTGYEALSKAVFYLGSDKVAEEYVKSRFKTDSISEFGFNLIFAEIL